jgi:hypothetical protein
LLTDSGLPLTSRAYSAIMASGPESVHHVADEPSPPVPWWDRRYRDWFGVVALTSVFAFETCSERASKCSGLLEEIAVRCERDGGGRGNLFAPGLALSLALSHITGQPISGHWMASFRDATGANDVAEPEDQPLPLRPSTETKKNAPGAAPGPN